MSDRIPLGWGAVGIGAFFQNTIAPAVAAEPDCELKAVTSRDPERARATAEAFGAEGAYTDFADLLADPRVDIVYVATPNALHAEQVVAAAGAGKHVLCEKPLALTISDARTAVGACESAGVALGVDFHNRFLPWVQDASRMVAQGTIGAVEAVEVEVGSGPRHYDNWRADPALAGLGTVHNVGVHALDFLRVILSAEPVEVMAVLDEPPGPGTVEMLALLVLRFDNGALVYANCNERLRHPRNAIAIHGTNGRIIGTDLTRSRHDGDLTVLTEQGETTTHYPAPEAHRRCLAAFNRAVLDDRPPAPSGVDGLRSVELCEAIARSARERRLVEVVYS